MSIRPRCPFVQPGLGLAPGESTRSKMTSMICDAGMVVTIVLPNSSYLAAWYTNMVGLYPGHQLTVTLTSGGSQMRPALDCALLPSMSKTSIVSAHCTVFPNPVARLERMPSLCCGSCGHLCGPTTLCKSHSHLLSTERPAVCRSGLGATQRSKLSENILSKKQIP